MTSRVRLNAASADVVTPQQTGPAASLPLSVLPSKGPPQRLRQWQGQNNVIVRKPAGKIALRTLLIDNYDSYTYNLFQLLADVNGVPPMVVRNDEYSWRELTSRLSRGLYDNVVISPGPGTPLRAADAGVCNLLLEEAETVPILGVCFGMQALAHVHGARILPAPEPIHGRLSEIQHTGHPLFAGIPSGPGRGFEVVRYHSLAVDEASLPACLQATAWATGAHHAVSLLGDQAQAGLGDERRPEASSSDSSQHGLLMGLSHTSRPHHGVQFHPESVATRHGKTLLRNFRDISSSRRGHHDSTGLPGNGSELSLNLRHQQVSAEPARQQSTYLDVRWRVLKGRLRDFGGADAVFWNLFGGSSAADTFWLDSASEEGQRFSFMGGRGGPLWERLTFELAAPGPDGGTLTPGLLRSEDATGCETSERTHFLDFLDRRLKSWRCRPAPSELPFDFTGGFVGYLGYELKAECGAPGRHRSPHPDAAMFMTDRVLAVDHATGDLFLVGLHRESDATSIEAAEAWLEETAAQLESLGRNEPCSDASTANHETDARQLSGNNASTSGRESQLHESRQCGRDVPEGSAAVVARRSRDGYLADVEACLEALRLGESYELCMTTQLERRCRIDARELYSKLRRSNPSAHAAWLSFKDAALTVCCSSPERFLRGTHGGIVEARPIKGTAARSPDPTRDAARKASLLRCEKSRAENLMIVDLLRNDLGRFCEVGSVHVSELMKAESYATVHNLVSTIRGVRAPGRSVVDCLRAVFPGGSMTGAPKLRSMQILDRLENGPRGIYSGSLGYIALNGTFDLNIVIRTAVVTEDGVSVGAGGAVVLQSDPEQEHEEMRLKARALLEAIDSCVHD